VTLENRAPASERWRVGIFPDTRLSVVAGLSSDDPAVRERAVELVVRAYRAPVIAVLRQQWGLDTADAEDLAHDFLAHALERSWLARYDAAKGRFRTFLRVCLRDFTSTARERAGRQKRGGHLAAVPLDSVPELAADGDQLDALFQREWVRSVMTLALEGLREECLAAGREATYEVFVAHDVAGADLETPPSYAATAARFALPVSQVANYLNWARARFRTQVIETLRALTASDAEFRDEARALLGRAPE
jgi:hypothetical protein